MRGLPVLLLCALVAAPLWAETPVAWHGEVRQLTAGAPDHDRLLDLADRMAGGITLPTAPEAATASGGAPVEVRPGEIQAALTQLAILSGGNGHLALKLAQAGGNEVIDLISGTATLADLDGIDGVERQRETGWRLTRPLVVWPGAALLLGPGEVLELDTASGAFVLSFGRVQLTDATLRGDGGQNATIPAFRPFLLVTGQGVFRAERSTFADLGYPGPAAFRGVSVLTGGLMRPGASSVVTESRFDRVFSLSFEGADGLVLTGNHLAGAGAAAVSIKGGAGMVLGGNDIRDTREGAAIRLSGALKRAAILGNLLADGQRNGLQIDGSTEGLVLRGNVIAGNVEAGVSIRNATCLSVEGNILFGNGSAGLRLDRSGLARVANNAILSNGGAGIEVQAQTGLGSVLVSQNLIARNRDGLRAAGLGEVHLIDNDLADQLPRQFAGDFGPWLAPYLTAGTELVIPAAADAAAVSPEPCPTE